MFRSLRIRNYRLYFTGNVISQVGTWMNRVAQDWLVLQLTHDDPVALGIATGLQFGPILLLSVWAGILADRYDKRKLLVWIQVVLGLSGIALGTLAWSGSAHIWHVYIACVVVGCASALDGPLRQSFVVEIVGPRELTNAVGLNSMGFNGARIVGPAIAGVLIALVDTGPVMVVAGVSYLAVIIGLTRMRKSELHPSPPVARAKGQARAGFAYVRRRPDLMLVLTLLFLVATFGMNFQLTLAVIARIVFHRDASSYGLLTTALAVGALLGALISARRTKPPRLRLLVGTALAFGITEIILGLTGSYVLLAVLLVPQGVFMLMFVNAANAIVQLSTPAEMRGRVMGIYTLVFLGGTPFIAPVLGMVAERFGGGAPLVLGGLISAIGAVVLGAWIARAFKVHVQLRVHPVPHVHVVNPDVDDPDDEHLSQTIAASMERIAGSARRSVGAPARAARRAGRAVTGAGRTARRRAGAPRTRSAQSQSRSAQPPRPNLARPNLARPRLVRPRVVRRNRGRLSLELRNRAPPSRILPSRVLPSRVLPSRVLPSRARPGPGPVRAVRVCPGHLRESRPSVARLRRGPPAGGLRSPRPPRRSCTSTVARRTRAARHPCSAALHARAGAAPTG